MAALTDERKGFRFLADAFARLRPKAGARALELIIVGVRPIDPVPQVSIPTHIVEPIFDEERMALYLAAADALVLPSLQENQPNLVVEAMACGTPSVAFRASGLPDLVEHEETGYLAPAFESEGLARGIEWVLEDEARGLRLGVAARRRAERDHDLESVAGRYKALYETLLPDR